MESARERWRGKGYEVADYDGGSLPVPGEADAYRTPFWLSVIIYAETPEHGA